jgi:hypothetical protein
VDDVFLEVQFVSVQGEYLGRAHRRLADSQDGALDDQAVVVGSAGARTPAQSHVL